MLCKVRPVAKKGRGLVATRDVRVGECILQEEPLVYYEGGTATAYLSLMALLILCSLTSASSTLAALMAAVGLAAASVAVLWEVDGLNEDVLTRLDRALRVCRAVRGLGEEQRRLYFDMCGKPGHLTPIGRCVGIFDLNALNTGTGAAAVYPTLCMLNHACTGNANPSWHVDKQRAFVHAIKPIREGEEITFSYAESFATTSERQFDLKEKWLFECACAVCSGTDRRREASDLRRTEGRQLLADVRRRAAEGQDVAALQGVEKLLSLVDKEFGSAIEKTELCVLAYQLAHRMALSTGDARLVVKWAAAARCYYTITRGPTHPDIMLLAPALSAVPEDALEALAAKCASAQTTEFLRLCDKLR